MGVQVFSSFLSHTVLGSALLLEKYIPEKKKKAYLPLSASHMFVIHASNIQAVCMPHVLP